MDDKIIIRHVEEVQAVDCPCGKSTRLITREFTDKLNFHQTDIKDSERHYHKKTTEVYYILEGQGTLFLENQSIIINPGQCIYIPTGVRHQVKGEVRAIIVGVPALYPDDEYFD